MLRQKIASTDLSSVMSGYSLCAQTEGKSKNTVAIVTNSITFLYDFLNSNDLSTDVTQIGAEEMTGTDAECCAYLYTAALTNPMDHDWGQIYLYIATKTYRRWGKHQMPSDIAVDSLSEYQLAELNRLKEWLYRKRTQTRLERERAERRQKKEEEAARRKAEQPALFHF